MRIPLIVLAVAVAFATPAEARRFACSAPLEEWQPAEALAAKLRAEGTSVRSIRVDHGCYRVEGSAAGGASLSAVFDPKSLDPVVWKDDHDGDDDRDSGRKHRD